MNPNHPHHLQTILCPYIAGSDSDPGRGGRPSAGDLRQHVRAQQQQTRSPGETARSRRYGRFSVGHFRPSAGPGQYVRRSVSKFFFFFFTTNIKKISCVLLDVVLSFLVRSVSFIGWFHFLCSLWLQLAQKRRPKVASGSGKDPRSHVLVWLTKKEGTFPHRKQTAKALSSFVLGKIPSRHIHTHPPTSRPLSYGEKQWQSEKARSSLKMIQIAPLVGRALAVVLPFVSMVNAQTTNRVEIAVKDKSNVKLYFLWFTSFRQPSGNWIYYSFGCEMIFFSVPFL